MTVMGGRLRLPLRCPSSISRPAQACLSVTELLAIDLRVCAEVNQRSKSVKHDGNLVIEFVCNQCKSLFEPDRANPARQLGRRPDRSLVRRMLFGARAVGEIPDSGLWRPQPHLAAAPLETFAQTNASWAGRCRDRVPGPD